MTGKSRHVICVHIKTKYNQTLEPGLATLTAQLNRCLGFHYVPPTANNILQAGAEKRTAERRKEWTHILK